MFSMMHIKPPLFLSSDSKSSKTKENSTEFSYGISLDRIRMPPFMRPSNGRAQSMNLQCSQTGENIGAFRASAKAGININESMEFLIREIIKRMEGMASEGKPEVFTANRQSVVLDTKKHTDESQKRKKENDCC